jgi:hypothetical protein
MSAEIPTAVFVQPDGRGAWEVALPDHRRHVACATLDDAMQMAHGSIAGRRRCELVVRDAYHRVVRRELIDLDTRA